MLYLANRSLNTIEEVFEKNVSYDENIRYFNASTFEKDEAGKASAWLSGKHAKSSYRKQLEVISENPIKVFFDLEFIKDSLPYKIWSLGFVVTKDNSVVERFHSLVNPGVKLGFLDRKKFNVNQEELDEASSIGEVLDKAGEVLSAYGGADCFSWGCEDLRIIKGFNGLAATMFADSRDLQKIVRHKFEVPVISLENALKYSDYFFVHQFNPLEDSLALSFVYLFAESCDETFISGLFAYKEFFNKKKLYEHYKSLCDNKEMYEERIAKASLEEKLSDREQRKLNAALRKLEEMRRYESIVSTEDFYKGFSDMMFVGKF